MAIFLNSCPFIIPICKKYYLVYMFVQYIHKLIVSYIAHTDARTNKQRERQLKLNDFKKVGAGKVQWEFKAIRIYFGRRGSRSLECAKEFLPSMNGFCVYSTASSMGIPRAGADSGRWPFLYTHTLSQCFPRGYSLFLLLPWCIRIIVLFFQSRLYSVFML